MAISSIRPNTLGIHSFEQLVDELVKLGVPCDEERQVFFNEIMDRVKELASESDDSYFAALEEGNTKTPEGLVEDRCNKAIRVLELAKIYSENYGF